MIRDPDGLDPPPGGQIVHALLHLKGDQRIPAARILRDHPIHVARSVRKLVEQLDGGASLRLSRRHSQ
jgi:hypothetical protein